jgi:hypothetical protein
MAHNRKDPIQVMEYIRDESIQKRIIGAAMHAIGFFCLQHAKLAVQE